MDNYTRMLRKASLREIGCFLMEIEEPGDALSAEFVRSDVEDHLQLALCNNGEDLDAQMQDVMEEAWEKGEMTGFMEGMRAGARLMLSLLGDGEILI